MTELETILDRILAQPPNPRERLNPGANYRLVVALRLALLREAPFGIRRIDAYTSSDERPEDYRAEHQARMAIYREEMLEVWRRGGER